MYKQSLWTSMMVGDSSFRFKMNLVLLSRADPEILSEGGPNFITFFLVDEGIHDPNITINGPSSAHQRNGVSLAGR